MSRQPKKLAWGECWTCTSWFWYGVLTVPSVPVDRAGRPVEETGTTVYRLAPICPECLGRVNAARAAEGLALLDADPLTPAEQAIGPVDPAAFVQALWFVPTNGLPYQLDEVLPRCSCGRSNPHVCADTTQEFTPVWDDARGEQD